MVTVHVPDPLTAIAERTRDDFGAFAYDGFGIMLSSGQLEVYEAMGGVGPRKTGDPKILWLSGAQRGGKTVDLALLHARANLFKEGVDNSEERFWRNYQYATLAVGPTNELAAKLWLAGDELSKGASDAQFDRRARRARGGAFLPLFKAGATKAGPIWRFKNGGGVDFRSTEGWAFRLEGGAWWLISWDEWASQPDRQIHFVLTDVLMGRSRDHDAKIIPAAWPKPETERHLIAVIRKIEAGRDRDSKVVYLSALDAHWSNRPALEAERRRKDEASWKRTVLGQPAGGSSIEFPVEVVENMWIDDLPFPALYEPGPWHYLTTWDLGLAHDNSVGITWRIPAVGVTPETKARIVNLTEMKGSEGLTLDALAFSIAREQALYRSQTGVDASSFGGVAAFRQLRELSPRPWSFVLRSNDRVWGNMRLAAITNGLDMLTWGRPDGSEAGESGSDEPEAAGLPWGLIESPRIPLLADQLANFDRDAKHITDDAVFAFLIGLWYIRRYWVVLTARRAGPVAFDVRAVPPRRRLAIALRRAKEAQGGSQEQGQEVDQRRHRQAWRVAPAARRRRR